MINESSKFYYLFFLLIVLVLLTSCTTVSYETVYPTLKDGVPNFELVGIIQWAPGVEMDIIIPKKRKSSESYSSILPYEGKLFVKKILILNTG